MASKARWRQMERRLIVEQFDPERPVPGGIDTCIRSLVKYCPPDVEIKIAGVDALGNKTLGKWYEYDIGGRSVSFMPLAQIDYVNLRRAVPHSVRVASGLRKYRPAPKSDVIQTHRINTGAIAMRLYPEAEHVQFIHSEGDLGRNSQSFFRHAEFAYHWLEKTVLPRSIDAVVFSKLGAERLHKISQRVRFSPTWFDPDEFYLDETRLSAEKTRIIWACRIEPGKNPELAVKVIAALPARYTLTVAGAGSMESLMRRKAQQSKAADRISFIGPVPKSEIGQIMREHDLMLMTSSFEGFSRSIVEGLATGLPVVTTTGGEPNGLVQDGLNGARVDGYHEDLFVPAFEVASKVSACAARDSVSLLSAASLVPRVLTIPELPLYQR